MNFQSDRAFTWGVLKDGRFIGRSNSESPPEYDYVGSGWKNDSMTHVKLSCLETDKDLDDAMEKLKASRETDNFALRSAASNHYYNVVGRNSGYAKYKVYGRSWYDRKLDILFISEWGSNITDDVIGWIKAKTASPTCKVLIQDAYTMQDDEWEEVENKESLVSAPILSPEQQEKMDRIKKISELLHTADPATKEKLRNEIAKLKSEMGVDSFSGQGSIKGASVAQRAGFPNAAAYNASMKQECLSRQ